MGPNGGSAARDTATGNPARLPAQLRVAGLCKKVKKCTMRNRYLCIYDLYGLVHNTFDAVSIHYEGKWERVEPWKSKLF
jgi:hypothetical protein